MAEEYAVQTAGLTKVFRDFWGHARVVAVDGLDLEVRPGEVFGLLGPNGSGKSTTIKMLLGLLHATKGLARVLGAPPGDVKTNRRIGYLPEESHLYTFLNARETLDFYGRLFGLPRDERRNRIDSLLDMVGLGAVGRRAVGEFSKGMARRIGLAQALINDPDLLILDEPTSGLDPIGTRQIKDLVRELGRRGKTVILCSHLLSDVEDICDRLCILYGGKVQALGAVDELLAQGDKTQIELEHLSDATLEQIRVLVQRENPDGEVVMETPRVRLEDYFLNTVAAAQAAQKQTSGVLIGSGVSDFLSDRSAAPETSGRAVIDTLVQAKPHQPAPTESAPAASLETVAPEPPAPRSEVLESLVRSTAPPPDAATETITPVEPSAAGDTGSEAVDRSVIDALTKGAAPPSADTAAEDETDNPDDSQPEDRDRS